MTTVPCPDCDGSGLRYGETCPRCDGSGRVVKPSGVPLEAEGETPEEEGSGP